MRNISPEVIGQPSTWIRTDVENILTLMDCRHFQNVVNFMNTNCKDWTFNKRQLQHAITTMCGPYTIFFLMYKGRYGLPMYDTIKMMFPDLTSPVLMNDVKVQISLKKRFGLFMPLVEMDMVMKQLLQCI